MSYGSTGDNWLQDRDKLLSLVNEISKDIQERNKQLRNGQKSAQKNTQIRNSINNLGKEIIKLDDTLNKIARNPQTYNITDNELSRRRDMVNNLRNKKDELAAVLSQGDSVAQESGKNPNRDSLLGSGEKKNPVLALLDQLPPKKQRKRWVMKMKTFYKCNSQK